MFDAGGKRVTVADLGLEIAQFPLDGVLLLGGGGKLLADLLVLGLQVFDLGKGLIPRRDQRFQFGGEVFEAAGEIVPFSGKGIALAGKGISFSGKGIAFSGKGVAFASQGIPLSRESSAPP